MARLMTLVVALIVTLAAPALSQTWQIDSNHSNAQFAIRHMMVSTVRGTMGRVTGSITFDGKNVSGITAEATIDVTGIDTDVVNRDNHLKSADFFEVEKYPTITFKSKRAEPAGSGRFKLIGDLTMHGVTKEVTLDVEGPTAEIKDQRGSARIGATATTRLNRRDFGLNYNALIEAGGVVGDDVTITVDLELIKRQAQTPSGPGS